MSVRKRIGARYTYQKNWVLCTSSAPCHCTCSDSYSHHEGNRGSRLYKVWRSRFSKPVKAFSQTTKCINTSAKQQTPRANEKAQKTSRATSKQSNLRSEVPLPYNPTRPAQPSSQSSFKEATDLVVEKLLRKSGMACSLPNGRVNHLLSRGD